MSIGTPKKQLDYFGIAPDGVIVKRITKEEYESRKGNKGDNVRARQWEMASGETGVSYEETYNSLAGKILSVSFRDHDKIGKSVNVLIQNGEDAGVLSIPTSKSFATSLLEVLPNINYDMPVVINGYAKDKTRRVYVKQGEENVESHYKSWNDNEKKFDIRYGYPEVNEKEREKFGDKYWTRYFGEVEVFLVDEIEHNESIPKRQRQEQPEVKSRAELNEEVEEDISPEDIPF